MNGNQTTEGKQVLSSNQKQSLKKYAAFSLMFIVFAACVWLIFAPSADKKAKTEVSKGLNVNLPAPKAQTIIGDKKAAYEEEQQKEKQTEKMRSLQDFASILGKEKATSGTELSLADNKQKVFQKTTSNQINRKPANRKESSIQTSVSAYRDINRTLGSFYEAPKTDPEKERLTKELEELKTKLAEKENRRNSVDEQMSVMEKSYQIASKYLPQMQGQTSVQQSPEKPLPLTNKPNVIPVAAVDEQVVSTLRQNSLLQETNAVFYTVSDGKTQQGITNTISACIHNDQAINDGQTVRLRLRQPFRAGSVLIPANEIISGTARIQGERLSISVTSLEYEGLILPVNLTVYDTDGQRGICIPNTGAVNAAKEIVANMGTSAGTSINLSSNAGQQLVADLGRSAIQGTSQYMAKKLREVKINLKAGYQVLLLPGNN
jgi:Bacteroides conjugative transposon TraM protein